MLLCGGALPEGIRPPAGVQVLALPPLGVGAAGGFVSHDPRYTVEQAWAVREERILAAFRAVRPVAVLVELFPFGRAKFARELLPLLEAARAAGALDRLQPARHPRQQPLPTSRPTTTAPRRSPTPTSTPCSCTAIPASPAWRRPSRRAGRCACRSTTPGFVVRDRAPAAPPRGDHVVVSAGGGLVGEPLLRAAAEAQPDGRRADAADRRPAAARRRVAAR